MNIESPTQTLPGSFRDPSGFMFRREGILYRQINPSYEPEYRHLMESGLYRKLVQEGLLISHEEEPGQRVLRPALIPFISYPYEWCFSQLKQAALATLKIQRTAWAFGMTLKDAAATNVQFLHGKPVWIDTLSFERVQPDEPWVAYRQFCEHFLAPLALMAWRDPRLGRLTQSSVDGIPLDLAAALLPRRTRWIPSLLIHLHLHAKAQQAFSKTRPGAAANKPVQVNSRGRLAFLDHLESAVRSLRLPARRTAWSDYYETSGYSPEETESKKQQVARLLDRVQPVPKTAWDLGANTGLFSRITSRRGIFTVSMDSDMMCVEENFRACADRKEQNLLPLWIDLTNPSPALGWAHQERMSLRERGPADVALALALVHHLALGNNVPLPRLAESLRHGCRWLIIEFVPKSDPQARRLLVSRKDVFPEYHLRGFEAAFEEFFVTRQKVPVAGTERTLYLLQAKEESA